MYGDRNDGQVEVVEHDRDVVVEASPRVEVKTEGPTADQRDGCYLCQSEECKKKDSCHTNTQKTNTVYAVFVITCRILFIATFAFIRVELLKLTQLTKQRSNSSYQF